MSARRRRKFWNTSEMMEGLFCISVSSLIKRNTRKDHDKCKWACRQDSYWNQERAYLVIMQPELQFPLMLKCMSPSWTVFSNACLHTSTPIWRTRSSASGWRIWKLKWSLKEKQAGFVPNIWGKWLIYIKYCHHCWGNCLDPSFWKKWFRNVKY
jgi:hypothetical protein